MKRFMRKAKNVALKTITTVAAIGFVYSVLALEISMLLPLLGVFVTSAWIVAYCYANRERFGGEA